MQIRSLAEADVPFIQNLYQQCFSGPPWNSPVSFEEAIRVWADHSSRPSFTCLVATSEGEVIGASWFNLIALDQLETERGLELAKYVRKLSEVRPIIWIRETIVDSRFQGKGVASQLKTQAIRSIEERWPTAVLLTRMRDDNLKIVRANERLGFSRTGIRVASRATPGLNHEYWFLAT